MVGRKSTRCQVVSGEALTSGLQCNHSAPNEERHLRSLNFPYRRTISEGWITDKGRNKASKPSPSCSISGALSHSHALCVVVASLSMEADRKNTHHPHGISEAHYSSNLSTSGRVKVSSLTQHQPRHMPDSESIYPSKVDAWLAIVLITTPLLVTGLGFYFSDLVTIILGLFMAAGFAALAIPCRYTLTNRHLLIQCGVLRERIQLKNIRDALLTSDPLSAPALSLRRIKIELNKGFRLISPRDRERFICELKQKIGNI